MIKDLPDRLAGFLLKTRCSKLQCSVEEKQIHFKVCYQLLITNFLNDRMCKILDQNTEQLANFQRILHIPLKIKNSAVLQPGLIGGCIRVNSNQIYWHKSVNTSIPDSELFSNFREYVEVYNIGENETEYQDCIIPIIYEIAETFESISQKLIYAPQIN